MEFHLIDGIVAGLAVLVAALFERVRKLEARVREMANDTAKR